VASDTLVDLLERDAVEQAIIRLFVSTDNRDWAAVEDCFTESVAFDMSSTGAGPPAEVAASAVADGWRKGLERLQAIHHQAGNFRVRIDGDRATAACYAVAWHYLPNRTGRDTRTFVGGYDVALEKHGGAWRISAFRYNLKFREGNLELESSGPPEEPRATGHPE
jgi:3-phenylpropionate/cinnamic acid dioxygenase small subunit